jgi:hypothetical protein
LRLRWGRRRRARDNIKRSAQRLRPLECYQSWLSSYAVGMCARINQTLSYY